MEITVKDREDLQKIADYLSKVPGLAKEDWQELWRGLIPCVANNLKNRWIVTGIMLDAYFNDKPNPIQDLQLTKAVEMAIKENTSFYASLSYLFFEAEKYIKDEATGMGLDLSQLGRTVFVELWALEDCYQQLLLFQPSNPCWEGEAPSRVNDRLRDLEKIHDSVNDQLGDLKKIHDNNISPEPAKKKISISPELAKKKISRWHEEDGKLYRTVNFKDLRPWTDFCIAVFVKYEEELPTYTVFKKQLFKQIPKEILPGKGAVINGQTKYYPGRKKKKAS